MTTAQSNQARRVLAGPASYQLDPSASSVTFSHKTIWGLVTVRGAVREA